MISAIAHRVRAVYTMINRATLVPLLVRCGVFLSALVALAVAYPVSILASRLLLALLLVALLPALAPRRSGVTLAVLVAVAGWVLATSWYDEPIALWRLLILAGALYLTHSLGALAALLPYDVVVAPDVVVRWVLRALVVVLASAVLAVLLLALAGQPAERSLLVAALGGLAVAVAATALLGWLLRRDTGTTGGHRD